MLSIKKKFSKLYKPELIEDNEHQGIYDERSRYYNLKIIKSPYVSDSPWVETWERETIPYSDNDIYIEFNSNYNGRLDLVSYDYYKTSRLWWVIAVANNIQNPFEKIEVGKILRIPSLHSIGL